MSVVGYPEDAVTYSPRHRCGGYYATLEAAKDAAGYLDFDVVIPPRCRFGFYLVPAASTSTEGDTDGPVQ